MPLSLLNDEQLRATHTGFGYNLVIASAGTGKTSTIVGRIAYLLQSGISPNEIMLLTFTNKASSEMIKRLESFFPQSTLKNIQAGTFHAIAYRHLKEYHQILLKQPRELKMLFKSLYDKRKFTQIGTNAPYKADYLYDLISFWVNSSPIPFRDFIIKYNKEHEIYSDIYNDIAEEFMELKREYGYASYDDLLLLYKEKVAKSEIMLSEVLVDEYQDTNHLQNSIIESLHSKSLFCVGDYDQSIYAFNGSDINIIASFKERFPNARIFSLNKNYRSSAKILDIANNVIANNPRIYPKKLEVCKDNPHSKIELLSFATTREQYQSIAKHIANSPTPRANIAIIFRNNITSDNIEACLRELGISAKKKGGRGFFESKEVAIFVDLLNLFFNKKDMMACVNVLSLGSGIGEGIAKDIYECLMRLGEGNIQRGLIAPLNSTTPYKRVARNSQLGLFDEFFVEEDSSRFNQYLSPDFASHLSLSHPKITHKSAIFLDKFYHLFRFHPQNLQSLIDTILTSEFFGEIKQTIAQNRVRNKYKILDSSKIDEAMEVIEKRIAILVNLTRPYDDLGRFLNSLALNSAESSNGEGVNLLTIHASKGLEFDDVYVIDLMDGRFPNTKLMAKTGSLEEERRLFYVATTRAKNNIFFSFAYQDSATNANYTPSIFLKEARLI